MQNNLKEKNYNALSIRLSNELYSEIKIESEKVGSTLNSFIAIMVKMGLDNYKNSIKK